MRAPAFRGPAVEREVDAAPACGSVPGGTISTCRGQSSHCACHASRMGSHSTRGGHDHDRRRRRRSRRATPFDELPESGPRDAVERVHLPARLVDAIGKERHGGVEYGRAGLRGARHRSDEERRGGEERQSEAAGPEEGQTRAFLSRIAKRDDQGHGAESHQTEESTTSMMWRRMRSLPDLRAPPCSPTRRPPSPGLPARARAPARAPLRPGGPDLDRRARHAARVEPRCARPPGLPPPTACRTRRLSRSRHRRASCEDRSADPRGPRASRAPARARATRRSSHRRGPFDRQPRARRAGERGRDEQRGGECEAFMERRRQPGGLVKRPLPTPWCNR